MTEMTPLVNKLESESELTSEQFGQSSERSQNESAREFQPRQMIGYMNTIQSLQTQALVLNKLPTRRWQRRPEFQNTFARQRSNLKMIEQEVKQ